MRTLRVTRTNGHFCTPFGTPWGCKPAPTRNTFADALRISALVRPDDAAEGVCHLRYPASGINLERSTAQSSPWSMTTDGALSRSVIGKYGAVLRPSGFISSSADEIRRQRHCLQE